MKRRIRHSLTLIFATVWHLSFNANAQELERSGIRVIAAGVDAKPIDRPPPSYPRKAAKRGVEGWVIISYTIGTDGTVSNVAILDQSISNYFEEEALAAPLNWKYEPATINGEPVVQSRKRLIFSFQLQGMPKAATREFVNYYRKAAKALEEDDLHTLEQSIEKIHNKSRLNYYETQFLYALKAQLNLKRGETEEAITTLERVVYYAKGTIDKETHATLARQLYKLQIENNQLVDALYTYEWINWLEPVSEESEIFELKLRAQEILDGESPIAFKGRLLDGCKNCEQTEPLWIHDLYRKKFTFDQIDGEIRDFKLYCGFHWERVAFEPGIEYSRGGNWGSCDIYVYGTEGTTFRLIERH